MLSPEGNFGDATTRGRLLPIGRELICGLSMRPSANALWAYSFDPPDCIAQPYGYTVKDLRGPPQIYTVRLNQARRFV